LNEAMEQVAALDPERVRPLEPRFLARRTIPSTDQILGVSPEMVRRRWRPAKAGARRAVPESGRPGGPPPEGQRRGAEARAARFFCLS
jgi:hypothetical protein